jgi:hypothetical protein
MPTVLVETRSPTQSERRDEEAEIVFIRRSTQTGRTFTILACRSLESFEQWGAPREVLSENVKVVEEWRKNATKRK